MSKENDQSRSAKAASARFSDPQIAQTWAANDRYGEILSLPRTLCAYFVATQYEPSLIVEYGGGDGKFLEAFLEHFPQARGVLNDQSAAMVDLAKNRLVRFADRVRFVVGDATSLEVLNETAQADTVLTSRMTHMLEEASLADFYANLVTRLPNLRSLSNIDHVGGASKWFSAMFRARLETLEQNREASSCWHNERLASEEDHRRALLGAQFAEVTTIWKAYYTMALIAIR